MAIIVEDERLQEVQRLVRGVDSPNRSLGPAAIRQHFDTPDLSPTLAPPDAGGAPSTGSGAS